MVDALITGGSGFMGSSLARYLAKEGLTVETLDVVPQPEDLRDLGIPLAICDMRSYDALRASVRDVELVIHTAILQILRVKEDRKAGFEVNVQATENLCRIANTLPLCDLILAGS